MKATNIVTTLSLLGLAGAQSTASCSSTLSANYPAPSVADGYKATLIANDLTDPRSILFDSEGHLLVVEQEVGIVALTLSISDERCISTTGRRTVIADESLNHGIEFSEDGRLLYASSPDAAYRWEYDAQEQRNTSEPQVLITGMANSDHTTRTLLLSRYEPGMLIVTRGSTSNIDALASDIETGHSQIKAFNITNATSSSPYRFEDDGVLLGWGLRNDVGIDEEPTTGGIFSVENSVDQMERDGRDIHNTNPAEELNFLGYLNGTESPNTGANFGYPECYTAWDTAIIPNFEGEVGDQFAIDSSDNDDQCSDRQTSRLSFQPHTAPLDILFNEAGTAAWVSFHGSWNADPPVGYKVAVVPFEDGMPVAASTSIHGAVDVLSNADLGECPDNCFRPVGLAWDAQGRLFVSSDSTGEIYVIERVDGEPTSASGSNATGTIPEASSSGGGGAGQSTETGSGASPSETGAAGTASMSAFVVGLGMLALLI